MSAEKFKVPVSMLMPAVDPTQLGFEDTSELEPLTDIIGQERAVYVNASDIVMPPGLASEESDAPQGVHGYHEAKPGARRGFRFAQLYPGQIVRFQLNPNSPRGPRAEEVKVVFSPVK